MSDGQELVPVGIVGVEGLFQLAATVGQRVVHDPEQGANEEVDLAVSSQQVRIAQVARPMPTKALASCF